jgi:drug/metabolite transporter (DMT)-like permease
MRTPKLIDYILLIILSLIWASAFFNIKIATYSFGPVTIAFLRVFFGSIPVLLLCYLKNINMYVDEGLKRFTNIYAAAGHPNAIFKISFNQIIELTKGEISELSE